MTHKPIQFNALGVSFQQKTCFHDFTAQLYNGDRIAIIGRNGSGKSSLLRTILGLIEPEEGSISMPLDLVVGYVPQLIDSFESLSGGQRFNKALSEALALDPDLLLLDEPTNHLDSANRKSLFRLLRAYRGTLLIVSHDVELLRHCIDKLWIIDNGKVEILNGSYDDFLRERNIRRDAIESDITMMDRAKKEAHLALMKEQERGKKSRMQGKKNRAQGKWSPMMAGLKEQRAQNAAGRKKSAITEKRDLAVSKLVDLRLPEIIQPKFTLPVGVNSGRDVVSVRHGGISYGDVLILHDIYLTVAGNARIALTGENGSGKSTLIKAILNDDSVQKIGSWIAPERSDIGYLDQHYGTLDPNQTVLETIEVLAPDWPHAQIRHHLNDFLFRKNEEINTETSKLSGGERLRLSLAQIAARTPKLLILDEVTNNIDLETRDHVIHILRDYPGAMIAISHDGDFLEQVDITDKYEVAQGKLSPRH